MALKISIYFYSLVFFVSTSGFLVGIHTGNISGAILFIIKEFDLDTMWTELIMSVASAAAAMSSIIAGYLNDQLGRKRTTILTSFIFTIGAVLCGVATHKFILMAGRILIGVAIGLATTTLPVYIAEVTPTKIRGQVTMINIVFVTMGQFVAAAFNVGFSYIGPQAWRYMLGLAGVPSLIQLIGFFFMPESPRWLVMKKQNEEARKVLSMIRKGKHVEKELEAIQQSLIDSGNEHHSKKNVLLSLILDPTVRKALFVGCGLQLFQQICGINTVIYYSATILKMSGVRSDATAVWLTALVAATNFLFTFVGLYLVEKIGRRPLIIVSQIGVTISLIALGLGFHISSIYSPQVTFHGNYSDICNTYSFCDACVTNPACGFCYSYNETQGGMFNNTCLPASGLTKMPSSYGACNNTNLDKDLAWFSDFCPTPYSWLTVLGMIIYLAAFAPGMGPMPWTINSEIYPLWARSSGASIATATNWSFNLLISMTFLSLTISITKYGVFYLYAAFGVLGVIFMALFVPETKGKPLEEVQELFRRPWSKCC